MKAFSRVLYWLAYSVILSFMPVFIGTLSAWIFQYEFNTVDALADLLITDFCLAATVLRDTVGDSENVLARMMLFLMIVICFISSVFFGHIMMLSGLNQQVSAEALRNLTQLVIVLLSVTTVSGILIQISSKNPQ